MPGQTVMKFGGAALADGQAVERACEIVAQALRTGVPRVVPPVVPPVVVVSAHRGVTDRLEELARSAVEGSSDIAGVRVRHRSLCAQLGVPSEPLDRFWRELTELLRGVSRRGQLSAAELDLVLSFGERLSARVVAWALERRGVPATPVDAWDLGLLSDSNHGCARPLEGTAGSIARALEEVQGVAVVTGFVAKDESGQLTTLGRNGSDLTASVLAEAVGAREIQFWKTVDGILSADPDLVPEAHVVDVVTYAEAAELAFQGASVLHPSSVTPALRGSVAVRVGNVARPDGPCTVFVEELDEERGAPVSLACRRDVLRVELLLGAPGIEAREGARLLETLDSCGVSLCWLDAQGDRVSAYVVPGPGVPAVLDQLGPLASVRRDLATLALVGAGVDVGLRALETLRRAGVTVEHANLGQSCASQAFAIPARDLEHAARTLHRALVDPPRSPLPRSDVTRSSL